MKTLLSILILLCSFAVNAQQQVNVRNNTTMEIEVVFYIYDNNPCNPVSTYSVSLGVGASHDTPLLSSTQEYVWAEITTLSCVGTGLTVGTPMYCNSLCQNPGAPPTVTTASCSGNYNFVQARWVDCGSPGWGYLGIDEY